MKPFVLGIAGGSGSGKSTLVEHLCASPLGPHLAILHHDAYYLDASRMPDSIRGQGNWDHPDALDTACFVAHVTELLAGHAVEQPIYDFAVHAPSGRVVRVEPRPLVILEGILLLVLPEIREVIDLCVFVDTPPEERIMRRMLRDIAERGRSVESVAEQFRATVRPMHDRFVEPSRSHAHLIVPWDWATDPRPAVAVLVARLRAALGEMSGREMREPGSEFAFPSEPENANQ